MHRTRIAALLALAVLATPACARTTTGADAPQAHADPTTAPSAFPAEKIDTLLLSLDEVNRVASPDQPAKYFYQKPAEKKPYSQEQPTLTSCGKALSIGTVYSVGEDWSAYRSTEYDATQNVDIRLIVVAYPTEQLAKEAFSRIAEGLKSCTTDDEFALDAVTGTSAKWHSNVPSSETHSVALKLHDEVARTKNILIQVESSDPGSGSDHVSDVIEKVSQRVSA